MWDIPDDEEDVDHILDEFRTPSDSLAMSVEMTDFNNGAFDRDDVPAELVDHMSSSPDNDDSSDDDTDADDTLEEYNDEPSVDHDSDDNNTIIGSDVVESDDDEE